MAKNYYGRFQQILSDTTIEDLLQTTMGYQESCDGINAVNQWVKKNARSDANFEQFEDIFNCCLMADETLWFNLSWYIGWVAGVAQGLKTQGMDISDPTSCLAGCINLSLDGT